MCVCWLIQDDAFAFVRVCLQQSGADFTPLKYKNIVAQMNNVLVKRQAREFALVSILNS